MVHWWVLGAGFPIGTGDHGGHWRGHLKGNTDRTVSTSTPFAQVDSSVLVELCEIAGSAKMHEKRGGGWPWCDSIVHWKKVWLQRPSLLSYPDQPPLPAHFLWASDLAKLILSHTLKIYNFTDLSFSLIKFAEIFESLVCTGNRVSFENLALENVNRLASYSFANWIIPLTFVSRTVSGKICLTLKEAISLYARLCTIFLSFFFSQSTVCNDRLLLGTRLLQGQKERHHTFSFSKKLRTLQIL